MTEYGKRPDVLFTPGAEPFRMHVTVYSAASKSEFEKRGLNDCVLVFYDRETESTPGFAYEDANFSPRGYVTPEGTTVKTAIFVALPQTSENANIGLWREVRRAQSATSGRRKKNREPRFNRITSNDRVQRFGAKILGVGALASTVSGILLSTGTGNTAADVLTLVGGAGMALAGEEMITYPSTVLRRFDPRERSYSRFANRQVREGNSPIHIQLLNS